MTKLFGRLGATLAAAILTVGVLGNAPAQAKDTTWGGDAKAPTSVAQTG